MKSARQILDRELMAINQQLNRDLDEARHAVAWEFFIRLGYPAVCGRCRKPVVIMRDAANLQVVLYNENGTIHTEEVSHAR
jgi:hypothetical protein